MSQLANNQGGSFEFPSRPSDPSVVTPLASPGADSKHSEILSQAKIDRTKAEELIASFSDSDKPQQEKFVSFADDADRPPGDFAAADPYVNTEDIKNENVDVEFKNGQAAGETDKAAPNASGSNTKEPKQLTMTESNSVSQTKPGGVTNLSLPAAADSGGKVRTVDEILSTIPSYEPEPETSPQDSGSDSKAAPVAKDQTPVTQEATQPLDRSQFDVPSTKGENDQATIDPQLATGFLKHSPGPGQEEVPVSWFAQDEILEAQADSKSVAATATQGDPNSAGSLASAVVDPVSGEKQFNVSDFSEMADVKIQPIPNAYSDGDSAAVGLASPADSGPPQSSAEKIHSPLSNDTSKPEAAEKTRKSIPVTTIQPSKPLSSILAAASTGSVTSSSVASDSVVPGLAKAAVPVAGAATLAAALSSSPAPKEKADSDTSELGKLAKTPKPTPTIDDSEIAAAFAKIDADSGTQSDLGVCELAEETFGESTFESGPTESTSPQKAAAEFGESTFGSEPTQQASDEKAEAAEKVEAAETEETFLVHEGEVIQIDGNDGYDFIDLAFFDRSFATLSPGRIVIKDQNSSVFEVQYKNVQYALFADGVRVDLVDLPPKSG